MDSDVLEEVFSLIMIAAVIYVIIAGLFLPSDSNQGDESYPGTCHGVPGYYQTVDC